MNVARRKIDFGKILTNTAGLAAGGICGKFIVKKIAPNLDPRLKCAGIILAGAIIPEMAQRTPILANVGNGMMAIGGAELVGSFVPGLAGIYDDFDFEEDFDTSIGQEYYDEYDLNDEDLDNAIGADG